MGIRWRTRTFKKDLATNIPEDLQQMRVSWSGVLFVEWLVIGVGGKVSLPNALGGSKSKSKSKSKYTGYNE